MLGFQVHRAAADLVARSAGASRAVNGASADGGPGGREARRLRGRLRSRRGVAMAFAVFCGSREALLLTVLPASRSVPRQLARVSVHAPAPRQLVQPRDACPRRRAARGRRRRSTRGPQVTVGWEAVQGTLPFTPGWLGFCLSRDRLRAGVLGPTPVSGRSGRRLPWGGRPPSLSWRCRLPVHVTDTSLKL